MKKNVMMRVASALLVAVLLTTCAISGTFAKYVTSDSANDTARVAMFGVVVTAGGSLFDTTYMTGTNLPGKGTGDGAGAVLSVESDGVVGGKVVAPGTQSEADGLTFSISGKPEVDVEIDVVVTTPNGDIVLKKPSPDKIADMTTGNVTDTFELGNDYYPIQYTLWHKGVKVTDATNVNLDTLRAELVKLNATHVDAGTDLGSVYGDYKITWEWAYQGEQKLNGITFAEEIVDKADTVLGDLAAGLAVRYDSNDSFVGINADDAALVSTTNYNLRTGISIEITVTQID